MISRLVAPLALALVVLLAGCFSAAPSAEVATDVERGVGGASVVPLEAPTFRAPVLVGGAWAGAEPNVVVAPDERVYVAAAPALWRSVDGGASFEAVGEDACFGSFPGGACPPGWAYKDSGLDGFRGDAHFAADARGGLHFAGLNGASGPVPFQASWDGGATWTEPVDLAEGNRSDREWVLALPDGTLFVTWRDFGAPDADDAPARLLVRRSVDGGANWEAARVIADDALQGPLVRDPSSGALYTAFYDGGIRVARSTDQGANWTLLDVVREERDFRLRNGNPINIFPVAAVDGAGSVYVVWSEDAPETAPAGAKTLSVPRVYFAASTDGGASWTAPVAVSPEGRAAVLPWIVAGQAGRVAVAWYENRHGLPNEDAPDAWDVMLVQSVTADRPEAVFVGGRANQEPVHVGAICTNGGGCDRVCPLGRCVPTRACFVYACAGKDRSRLDFFEMTLGPDGHPVLVWTSDADPRAPEKGVRVFLGGVERGTPIG